MIHSISQGDLEKLRAKFPWPEQPPNVKPAKWELDGGGRELVLNKIPKEGNFLIVEIGVFLGSSLRQWLGASEGVHVIAIDPWEGEWWADYAAERGRNELVEQFKLKDGPYLTFLSSLWEQRNRIFPARGFSPAKLYELAKVGVQPHLIYFDSNKTGDDLEIAHKLFPSAIITGDDWTWGGPEYPIRKAVREFADKHGFYVRSHNATWVLSKDAYSTTDYVNKGIESFKDLIRMMR